MAEKIQAKEASRKQVLATMLSLPSANTSCMTKAVLAKLKQSAVSTMMGPAKTSRATEVGQSKENSSQKKARKATSGIQETQTNQENKAAFLDYKTTPKQ